MKEKLKEELKENVQADNSENPEGNYSWQV